MAKTVKVFFTDRRGVGNENAIYWDKTDSESLRQLLALVKQHDPKLFKRFEFVEGDFEAEKSKATDLFKTYFRNTKLRREELHREIELLQKNLDRPRAGRKKEDLRHVKDALSRSNDFTQFNKIIYESIGHTLSKSTYHRYKRQFQSR